MGNRTDLEDGLGSMTCVREQASRDLVPVVFSYCIERLRPHDLVHLHAWIVTIKNIQVCNER